MLCNTGGMTKGTKSTKDSRLNIRLDEDIRLDFHITARLRGANAATLIRQLIIEEVKKEKREHSAEKWEEMRRRTIEQEQQQQEPERERHGKQDGFPQGRELERLREEYPDIVMEKEEPGEARPFIKLTPPFTFELIKRADEKDDK
jgi:flagellar biosynthesis/type III secretory pathway protein FliH